MRRSNRASRSVVLEAMRTNGPLSSRNKSADVAPSVRSVSPVLRIPPTLKRAQPSRQTYPLPRMALTTALPLPIPGETGRLVVLGAESAGTVERPLSEGVELPPFCNRAQPPKRITTTKHALPRILEATIVVPSFFTSATINEPT